VSGTVTSHAKGFPLAQGRSVVPSGRLLSPSIKLTGSFIAGTLTLLSPDVRQMHLIRLLHGLGPVPAGEAYSAVSTGFKTVFQEEGQEREGKAGRERRGQEGKGKRGEIVQLKKFLRICSASMNRLIFGTAKLAPPHR